MKRIRIFCMDEKDVRRLERLIPPQEIELLETIRDAAKFRVSGMDEVTVRLTPGEEGWVAGGLNTRQK